MSQIDALQTRITMALDRITKGLEDVPDPEEIKALRQQLDDEKAKSARLVQEVTTLQETVQARDAALAAVRTAETASGETLRKLDSDLQALRAANQQLRDNNQALRDACVAGVADPDLITTSLQAELEGLRATRAADRAEVEAVLGELARVIDASGGDTATATETV